MNLTTLFVLEVEIDFIAQKKHSIQKRNLNKFSFLKIFLKKVCESSVETKSTLPRQIGWKVTFKIAAFFLSQKKRNQNSKHTVNIVKTNCDSAGFKASVTDV